MFGTLKNLKEKYQSSPTWTDFFLSLTGLDEMYKKLDEAKNDKEYRKIAEQIIAKQKEQIETLLKEVNELKEQQKKNTELNQILTEAKNNSDKLDSHIQEISKKCQYDR